MYVITPSCSSQDGESWEHGAQRSDAWHVLSCYAYLGSHRFCGTPTVTYHSTAQPSQPSQPASPEPNLPAGKQQGNHMLGKSGASKESLGQYRNCG